MQPYRSGVARAKVAPIGGEAALDNYHPHSGGGDDGVREWTRVDDDTNDDDDRDCVPMDEMMRKSLIQVGGGDRDGAIIHSILPLPSQQ